MSDSPSSAFDRLRSAGSPGRLNAADRLLSLDAYRGFIMMAMASSAFGFTALANNPDVSSQFADTRFDDVWRKLLSLLSYEFDHVPWTGCGFWDLIQPSFMFMVGVAMPFSYGRRAQNGQSRSSQWRHVLVRSLILVMLGVFLSSNGRDLTHFTLVNVLTQIGLGYPILFFFCENPARNWQPRIWTRCQLAGAVVILLGYGLWFCSYTIPAQERGSIERYVQQLFERKKLSAEALEKELALTRAMEGVAGHFNKHTNAAAAFDRWLLNRFPREEPEWEGAKFWINEGGYQTLNFIPSIATMLFGLMAGQVLRSTRTPLQILRWLLVAGLLCFLVSMTIDTSTWPTSVQAVISGWSLCPAVKRIWTPTWAVFSSGWTFWFLAAFYWSIDIRGWKRWAWPLSVVGMNSIAMYCMSQLMRGWTRSSLKTHFATLDSWLGLEHGLQYLLVDCPYAPLLERTAVLSVFWLICWWMYRQKIFVRI